MKILLLTSNSIQNMALSHLLGEYYELTGIVYENRFSKKNRVFNYLKKVNYNPLKIFGKLYQKYRLRDLELNSIVGINEGYKNIKSFYKTSIMEVYNINQKGSLDFIKENVHDIIVVSGTRLIKKELIALKPEYGIINMHTGLSPYYNGGPSCTFWCLFNGDIEYIGATVMYIDDGIDTGNIILSDTISLDSSDSYGKLEFKAIDLGNHLILRAIEKLKVNRKFKGYNQRKIGSGYTFYNKDFTFNKRFELQKKLKNKLIFKLIANRKINLNIKKYPN